MMTDPQISMLHRMLSGHLASTPLRDRLLRCRMKEMSTITLSSSLKGTSVLSQLMCHKHETAYYSEQKIFLKCFLDV